MLKRKKTYPLLGIDVNHFNVFSSGYPLIQIKSAPFQFSNDGPTQVLNFVDQYFEIKNNQLKDVGIHARTGFMFARRMPAGVLQMLCQMNRPKCFGPYRMYHFSFLIENADTNNTMFVISPTSKELPDMN